MQKIILCFISFTTSVIFLSSCSTTSYHYVDCFAYPACRRDDKDQCKYGPTDPKPPTVKVYYCNYGVNRTFEAEGCLAEFILDRFDWGATGRVTPPNLADDKWTIKFADDDNYYTANGAWEIWKNTIWCPINKELTVNPICNDWDKRITGGTPEELLANAKIFYTRTCPLTTAPAPAPTTPPGSDNACDADAPVVNIDDPFDNFDTYIPSGARLEANSINTVFPLTSKYFIDTRSNSEVTANEVDQTYIETSNRVVFFKITIPEFMKDQDGTFNKAVKYEILIYKMIGPTLVKSIPIGFEVGEYDEIVALSPTCKPNKIKPVKAVIKTTLGLSDVSTDNSEDFYFALSITYPSKLTTPCTNPLAGSENNCVDYISNPSAKITLQNYDERTNVPDNDIVNTRVHNILIGGAEGDALNLTKVGTTVHFKESYKKAWSNVSTSDIHVVPNFLPNNDTDKKSPNDEPESIILPNILVDDDGNAVLYSMDLEASKKTLQDEQYDIATKGYVYCRYDYAINKWFSRLAKYMYLYAKGKVTTQYITQKELDAFGTDGNSDLYISELQNFSPLVMINYFKLYYVTPTVIDSPTKPTSYTAEDDTYIISSKEDPDVKTDGVKFSVEAFPDPTFNRAETYLWKNVVLGGKQIPYTMSVVYKAVIDGLSTLSDKPGCYISSSLHELAHAWGDQFIFNSNELTADAQHAYYVGGEGKKYCLFKYVPVQLLDAQITQMQFSDAIENRLSNTLFIDP